MVCPPARNHLVSPCLPLSPHMCACVDGASAFPRSCRPLSPTVSPHVSLCWMVGQLSEGLVSPCLQLSWMVCPPSRGLVSPCLPLSLIVCLFLSPIVTPHVCPLDAVSAFPRSCLHCLRTCVPVLDGASAFPRSCLCLSLLVSACLPLSPMVSSHVCLCWLVPPPSRRLVFPCVGWCARLPEVLSALVS